MKSACDTTAFWKSVITNEAHSMLVGIDLGSGDGDYWSARCPACHWTGNSKDCDGGLPIADTGDYSELRCPRCESNEIEEVCDEA